MVMLKKIFLFTILILTIIIINNFYCFYVFAENQKQKYEINLTDSQFSKWFQWKMQSNLTEKQKSVVEYLKKSSAIFNKTFDTRCVQPESKYGYPNPKEAIKITKEAIKELKVLPCPKESTQYRDINIKIMKNIIIYHQLRVMFKEGTEEFNLRYEKFQLSEIKNSLDVKQCNEYFKSLRKVGLFDNIEEEIKHISAK